MAPAMCLRSVSA